MTVQTQLIKTKKEETGMNQSLTNVQVEALLNDPEFLLEALRRLEMKSQQNPNEASCSVKEAGEYRFGEIKDMLAQATDDIGDRLIASSSLLQQGGRQVAQDLTNTIGVVGNNAANLVGVLAGGTITIAVDVAGLAINTVASLFKRK